MDFLDPRHGTAAGWAKGCRSPEPGRCPMYPESCATVRSQEQVTYRERQKWDREHGVTDGAKYRYVMTRLDETIAVAGRGAVLGHTGMTDDELDAARNHPGALLDWDLAERLDAAWSFLVRGHDTTRPDFPHGGTTGYINYCCRCRRCGAGHGRTKKRHESGLKTHDTARVKGPDAEVVRRHARRLMRGATVAQVARAVGLEEKPVERVLNGDGFTVRTARLILATTPAQVAAQARLHPVGPVRHAVWTMRALGYPMWWIAEQSGIDQRTVTGTLHTATVVTPATYEPLMALAARVGDTAATPRDGISEHTISRTIATANRAGWYPPACYDDNRNLIPTAVPGHPWGQLDDYAAKTVRACYLAGQGASIADAARAVGLPSSTVENDSRRWWGYSYDASVSATRARTTNRRGSTLNLISSRDRFREVSRIFHDMEDGDLGAVTAAMTLGKRWGNWIKPEQRDHPDLIAWAAAEAAAKAEDNAVRAEEVTAA